nr:ATP-binding protein [Maribacter sp. ACAM166]
MENVVPYNILGKFPIHLGSTVIFGAFLFAVLLIYIREGVLSARVLILGILISGISIIVFSEIFTAQNYFMLNQSNDIDLNASYYSPIDYRVYFIGTTILVFDFIVLVSTYQLLISKMNQKYYFLILFISLWLALLFDALLYNTSLLYDTSYYMNSLIGNFIGKTLAAFLFSILLYMYLTYIDKAVKTNTFIANQRRDVFSILSYQQRYIDLQLEKETSEEKLNLQFEKTLTSISDGIVTLDKNWRYTYVKKKAAEFLDRTPDNLIGANIWTEFPDEVGGSFYCAYYKAFKTQETQILQEYYAPTDKYFENRIFPTVDGLTIYLTDITDKKQIENALNESEAFKIGILSSLSSHIAVIDETGLLIATNKAWDDFSLNNGEINLTSTGVGSNYFEICNKAITEGNLTAKKVLNGLTSILQHKTTDFTIEYLFEYEGGERSWFLLQAKPFGEKSNKLVLSHIDITAVKIADEERIYTNLKLKEAQRISKVGSWEFNPLTKEFILSDEMYHILELNKVYNADLYDTFISKLLPEDGKAHKLLINNALNNEKGYFYEYYIKVDANKTKYIHEIGEIVKGENNEVLKLKGTIQDITNDKLAHDELMKYNEELQKANKELDRFVYSASHDLRSPLTSLRGLIQVLEMNIDPSHQVNKEPINLMTKTINKMDDFITDILDYSLNTRTDVIQEEINIEELIKSVWEDLEYMDINYKPKRILDVTQTADFFSDPKRITIIINNLISNAFKYHDENKIAHFIKISIAVNDIKAVITIEDNGIGISKDNIHKIFEMFQRVTKLSKGSGMGLYIVKETIEKLQGSIHVESELEKGTKFSIEIPNLL